MSRSSSIIVLATLIILVPVSGLPIAYRSFLTVMLGAAVLGIGLSMRTLKAPREHGPTAADPEDVVQAVEEASVTSDK